MYVGLRVRRRPRRLDAAALVDRHVDDHRPRLHQLEVLLAHQPRRTGPFDQHGADHQVGPHELLADVVPVAVERVDVGRHDVFEISQPVDVDVEDDDVGLKAGRDLGRVLADDAAAENGRCAPAARRARRPAECRGLPAAVRDTSPLPECSCGRRLRSSASGRADRPLRPRSVSYATAVTPVASTPRVSVFAGGEMEVGEDDLPAPQQRPSPAAAALSL